ncbi:MAG: tRNA (N(6)-L-threonylcarbamoyladenosine(37)-C(2))-methylthiotransferase MtaB [Gammaproteobacteria bacterium]|nr:tRNA (N(6)-L-threonylcarbamoyladenosine(37)-C(2))-methylthiotransferase MtaB [Gammaproteobacteria bacterium]
MKINFQALGCRLNEAELENWSSEFLRHGHQLTMDSRDADLVVFNSCSVTAEADRKSRNQINRIHKTNPQCKLVVTGCYASLQQPQVEQQLGVDMVINNQAKDQLVQHVLDRFGLTDSAANDIDRHSLFERGRHRAFIKVQDGCRYRCTFCIVTVARGEERSRSAQDIIQEINRHHQQGVQEIAITGVHVGGYGSDLGSSLYQLLSEILDQTSIPRIRLASVEPWDLPDNFFQLFSDPRLMPHMHLPLQSGADTVLRRMARRCKTVEFAALVEKARATIPLFNITTDLIVGFPGETEQEWQQTMKFVEEIGFGHMHIFTYSRREGTKAARLPDQLPRQVKQQRSREMHQLANQLKYHDMAQHLGKQYQVLWETSQGPQSSVWSGYTPHYHRVQKHSAGLSSSQISGAMLHSIRQDDLIFSEHIDVDSQPRT